MSLILNIDTSTGTASVSLAENDIALHTITNANQKDHAAFLHDAINDIIKKESLELKSLDAIAVINGPGSYTGLRVGMASAKGLCYALDKPFITIGSLNLLANAVIENTKGSRKESLYCPLIDARRMEVFTALFDNEMNEILAPAALILDENSFKESLEKGDVYFFGNGAKKFESVLSNENAVFVPVPDLTVSMAKLAFEKFTKKIFTHLIDSEPLYIKDFHSSMDLHNKK